MNKRIVFIFGVFIGLIIAGGMALYILVFFGTYDKASLNLSGNTPSFIHRPTSTASVEPVEQTGLTYLNDKYGFSVSYPEQIVPVTSTFETFYQLADNWSMVGNATTKGKLLVSIPIYRVENKDSYPGYYSAEVRVGVSGDPKDLKNCLVSSSLTGAPETKLVNGETFTLIPVANSGMSQYLVGYSYRIVRNNLCYAIEQLKMGSNYGDVESQNDIPDSVLNEYFSKGDGIIKTFELKEAITALNAQQ